jgi:hypothetical protein
MSKAFYIPVFIFFIGITTSAHLIAGDSAFKPGATVAVNSDKAEAQKDEELPLTFKNVIGNWTLKYSGNYGYTFSFYSNYRALVVLNLNMETLIFKGVYTIEEGNKLKINIYEMKEEHRAAGAKKGFVKAKSSYLEGIKSRKIEKKPSTFGLVPSSSTGTTPKDISSPSSNLVKADNDRRRHHIREQPEPEPFRKDILAR